MKTTVSQRYAMIYTPPVMLFLTCLGFGTRDIIRGELTILSIAAELVLMFIGVITIIFTFGIAIPSAKKWLESWAEEGRRETIETEPQEVLSKDQEYTARVLVDLGGRLHSPVIKAAGEEMRNNLNIVSTTPSR